jgi:hypothetical protein
MGRQSIMAERNGEIELLTHGRSQERGKEEGRKREREKSKRVWNRYSSPKYTTSYLLSPMRPHL